MTAIESDIDTIYGIYKQYRAEEQQEKNPIRRFRLDAVCNHLNYAMTLIYALRRREV